MSVFVVCPDVTNINFGKISKLIFETFVWFVSRCEEKRIHKIDEWVQLQQEDGVNAISQLFSWIGYLHWKVVFNNNIDIKQLKYKRT